VPQAPVTLPGASDAEINAAASAALNANMESCPHCGRTFANDRLAIHAKSCTAGNPARRVARAAPAARPPALAPARAPARASAIPPVEMRREMRRSLDSARSASTSVLGESPRPRRADDVLRESAPARLPRAASPPPPAGPPPGRADADDRAARLADLEDRAANLERVVRSALLDLRDIRAELATLR
jgi:hypothetical protein